MKLLFDENISWRIKKKLQNTFPVCLHVSDISPKLLSDTLIWNYAKEHNFIIVTFDEDFVDIQIINGFPPKILWLRGGNKPTNIIVEKIIKYENEIINLFLDKEQGIIEMY